MSEPEPDIRVPSDARWTELDKELLGSGEEREAWVRLAGSFDPFDRAPGTEMTDTLRDGIRQRRMHFEGTRALHNHELLGFYEFEQALVDISDQPGPLLGAARMLGLRKPQRGWLVSSIVRSRKTDPGFGRVLVAHPPNS